MDANAMVALVSQYSRILDSLFRGDREVYLDIPWKMSAFREMFYGRMDEVRQGADRWRMVKTLAADIAKTAR